MLVEMSQIFVAQATFIFVAVHAYQYWVAVIIMLLLLINLWEDQALIILMFLKLQNK